MTSTISDTCPDSLAAIVDASADAIIGLTLDGVVTSWNAAAERLYGYTTEEMIGARASRVVPPELHAAEQRLIDKVAAGARIDGLDTSRLRRDGGRLIVSLSLFPLTDGGNAPVAIAAIERDVTRHRALEAQLLQAKRMEALGRLAGGVAQEFNNINTAILGLADFVAQRLPEHDESRADLDGIAQQAMRGSRLAQHLLVFGGRQVTARHAVSVDSLLRSMEPLLQRLVRERVWLTLELAEGTARVFADESQLELVIFELVMNASEALDDHGTLSISTEHLLIDDSDSESPRGVPLGRYVKLAVRDSGSGLPAAMRGREFDPLYTTNPDSGHLGFGLVMVYGVVQELGGYISITSMSPSGTEVCVFLPVTQTVDQPRSAPAGGRQSNHGTETILVVEDEAPVRHVIARGLRAHGYVVLEAQDGEDALVVAGDYNAPIHLVVSDVIMPHMNGRELFDRLRAWYPTIRFLFVSGYTRGAITGEELKGDATEFLAKPFTIEQLTASARELLDHGSRRPA